MNCELCTRKTTDTKPIIYDGNAFKVCDICDRYLQIEYGTGKPDALYEEVKA